MNIKDAIIKPNYTRMRESFCRAVQDTWDNYCRAQSKYLKSIWFNKDGKMCMNNTEKYKKEVDKASAAFEKAQQDLVDFDKWVEDEKEFSIFYERLLGNLEKNDTEGVNHEDSSK